MINKIHNLTKNEFIEVFGNIFENARWIAEKLYSQKPFKDFEDLSQKMLNIFVPTSPNPTTGFLFMLPEKDTQPLKMSVEEGLKMIISFGMAHAEESETIKK